MTTKTCLTVNCVLATLLIAFGMIVFGGCSDENGTAYNGAYSNGTTDSSTAAKTSSTDDDQIQPQTQPQTQTRTQTQDRTRDTSTGMSEYNAALDRAQAQNKPVYLLFSATWCGPCKSYKNSVLSDAEVKRSLDNDVIFVYADIDRDKALARKYNVSGVPTGFLIKADENGQARTINSHVGGMDKQEFMSFIKK